MIEPRRRQRVLDQVGGRIGGGQGNRDHEVGGGKSQQTENQHLPLPAREETFEDEDAALPVRAHIGDAPVHRQRAEKRDGDQHERGHRRKGAGGQKRDARLIRQRRKIVDAGEAHDLPPRGRVRASRVRPDRWFGRLLEKPVGEALLEGKGGNRRRHWRESTSAQLTALATILSGFCM